MTPSPTQEEEIAQQSIVQFTRDVQRTTEKLQDITQELNRIARQTAETKELSAKTKRELDEVVEFLEREFPHWRIKAVSVESTSA